jgi:hypothetical protein
MKKFYVTKMSCTEIPQYRGSVIVADSKKAAIEKGKITLPQIGTGKTKCVFYADEWQ